MKNKFHEHILGDPNIELRKVFVRSLLTVDKFSRNVREKELD